MPEEAEREKLSEAIRQWNNNRLDLFEISQPDENLTFHGVMRFYFEDHVGENVATKCLRVCSNSSTREVIDTLSEKFRPDMKMLTSCCSLYEIHTSQERKLDLNERPLVVQLNWKATNREGRFVLKKDKEVLEEKCNMKKEKDGIIENFKRTFSRKEKNKIKASGDEDGSRSTEKQVSKPEMKEGSENTKQQFDQPELPVGIKFTENLEEAFLSAVINYTNSSTVHFKLSPAYVLYAAARFALQGHYRKASPPSGHTHTVTSLTNKVVAMTAKVIKRQQVIAVALAFWMANSSELLNFLKNDKDLSPLTLQSQTDLFHLVHKAYSSLKQYLQNELRKNLPTFLIDPGQHGTPPAGTETVLNTLMYTMSMLRRCRVNPALTIQLFSQLFHFISAWLFNQLMSPKADSPGLCSHYRGAALRQKITAIGAWAERQGLELAADCHLGHIIQATTLLTMNKYSIQDAKDIQSTCFKLNSLQLHTLLTNYVYAADEPHIPPDLVDAVVTTAEGSADTLIQSEGQDIQLEESLDLHLPFLLPDRGYCCDTVRGIPPGFREFLEPICRKGLCSLTSNSQGDWTAFFSEPAFSAESTFLAANTEPEIMTIKLNKPMNSGMGVSIVAAKGAGQDNIGIYIKSVVKGGPAEISGVLTAGDQLLSVDGQSLVGLSQERAAAIIMKTGPFVTLEVAKHGASYHGLQLILSDTTSARTAVGGKSQKQVKLNGSGLKQLDNLHESSKTKREQIMQRNRQLYRSNPNMTTDLSPDDRDDPGDTVRGNVSTNHLYNVTAAASGVASCCWNPSASRTFHKEYLTLPTPKSQKNNIPGSSQLHTFNVSSTPLDSQSCSERRFMRQALSQENLCGRPLLDRTQNMWEHQDKTPTKTMSHYSSFPVCPSVSTQQQQSSRTSVAGVWRTPPYQHPPPSVQPVRIDIPVTRAASARSHPLFPTFKQTSSLLTVNSSQCLNGHTSGWLRTQPHHDGLISATKMFPPSQQQEASTCMGGGAKHVTFQALSALQTQGAGSVRHRGHQKVCDPRRREAQEKQMVALGGGSEGASGLSPTREQLRNLERPF